jgi:hypothetical protein
VPSVPELKLIDGYLRGIVPPPFRASAEIVGTCYRLSVALPQGGIHADIEGDKTLTWFGTTEPLPKLRPGEPPESIKMPTLALSVDGLKAIQSGAHAALRQVVDQVFVQRVKQVHAAAGEQQKEQPTRIIKP